MQGGAKGLLAFAAVLLLVPSALAAQSTFEVRAELPVSVTGSHAVAADDAAFLYQGADGAFSMLLQAEQGTLDRVVHRAFGYIKQDEPELGVLWEQDVERSTLDMDGAYLTIDERLPTFTLLAYDADLRLENGAAQSPLHIGGLATGKTVRSVAEPPMSFVLGTGEAQPFVHTIRGGSYEARTLDGRLDATGGLSLFISDAVVQYIGDDPQTLQAHFREEERPGTVYDPITETWVGGGSHTEYIYEYLHLRLDAAQLQLQYLGAPATIYADEPSVAVDGQALIPMATGTVTVDDETTEVHDVDHEDLELAGRFGFTLADMDGSRTQTDVAGSGDLTAVRHGDMDSRYDWATLAAAAGLGAVILAGLAWAGKSGLGAVVGYARVQGDKILEHPGRQKTYDLIQAEPGMHFMELESKLDFGASSLNYHLRVLEKNGFVTRVKDGRYVRFFDRKNGEYAQERKTAASTLRNDTTARIAGFIIQNPGVAQRDVASAFGIAASTVSWHVQRLQKDGLVQKERDHHFTRYYMGDAWSSLPMQELARVGIIA